MSEARVFVVRQEREVRVRAHNPSTAVQLGTMAFDNMETEIEVVTESEEGVVVSEVKATEISAREDY